HRPDAFHLEPFSWQVGAIDLNRPEPTPSVALRRFRSKSSASVLLEENKPVHVRSSEMNGSTVAQSGPYLASGNWWDETAWMRAEWDLQLANGALLRCHQNPNGWQLDGIYD
ncbi:MAG TPA: hypothetical protein VN904_01980, partial [Chthoniobacterales bacterium]|nr:hypothetical protein [Chthoniobacterales bacterium]